MGTFKNGRPAFVPPLLLSDKEKSMVSGNASSGYNSRASSSLSNKSNGAPMTIHVGKFPNGGRFDDQLVLGLVLVCQ